MNKTKLIKLVKEIRLEGATDVVPKGYITREQMSKKLKVCKDTTCKIIKKLKEKTPEKINMKRFRIRNPSGMVCSIPHYKIDL